MAHERAVRTRNVRMLRPGTVAYQLIGALYAPGEVPFPDRWSWADGSLAALGADDVWPQLYQLLYETGRVDDVPSGFRDFLRAHRERALLQNLSVKWGAQSVLRLLDASGIPAIWLKGVRLAERYYGHCGARATTHIDLLIRRDSVDPVRHALRELGYQRWTECAFGRHREQWIKGASQPFLADTDFAARKMASLSACAQTGVLAHAGGRAPEPLHPLVVELYFDLVKPGTANLHLDALWADARLLPGYHHIQELSEQHTLYAACIHAASHSPMHLKPRLDIVHLLAREEACVNLVRLMAEARRDGTMSLIRSVLSPLYEEFPFLRDVCPLPPGFRRHRTSKRTQFYLLPDALRLISLRPSGRARWIRICMMLYAWRARQFLREWAAK